MQNRYINWLSNKAKKLPDTYAQFMPDRSRQTHSPLNQILSQEAFPVRSQSRWVNKISLAPRSSQSILQNR